MSICDSSNNFHCTRCGSDRFGFLCTDCVNIVCSCEPCPVCEDRENRKERDRARFGNDLDGIDSETDNDLDNQFE